MTKKTKPILRPRDENDIDDFLKHVELIYQCSYLQQHKEQNVKINWNKDEGLKVTNSPMPSRESIEAFLMRMRPVMVYEERLYIGKVVTYLIENSTGKKDKDNLEKLQQLIQHHKNKRLFSIKVDNDEYGIPDFVWLYLYGKYFHLDKDKQNVIEQFESVFGPLAEVSALSQIEAYAGWAMLIAK